MKFWKQILTLHIDNFELSHYWTWTRTQCISNTGVGTRGAGGLEPPKICEREALPRRIECALVNTYLKLCLHIVLAHDYCTNTPTASCVCPAQWFKERQHVHINTNVQCDLMNINSSNCFKKPAQICFSLFMNDNKAPYLQTSSYATDFKDKTSPS